MADVLVVIVTYNALKWVGKCLRSVEKSSHPADVVLIDNGSTDGTLSLVRTDFPQQRGRTWASAPPTTSACA